MYEQVTNCSSIFGPLVGIDQEKAEELLGEYNRSEAEKVDLEIMKVTEKVGGYAKILFISTYTNTH